VRLWLAALVGVGVLAGVIALTALSSVNGAPRGSVLDRPLASGPAVGGLAVGACRPGGGAGTSSIRLDGVCSGTITGGFGCVTAGEFDAATIRRPLADGRTFYLTIVLTDYAGPGLYSDDDVSVQLSGGPANAPRWTSRGSRLLITAAEDGSLEVSQGTLLPEPGTPATGVITLGGRASCR
jgi:hypothetical protein